MDRERGSLLGSVVRVDKLYLELLFHCNFRCAHCYHGDSLDRAETIDAAAAARALAYFASEYACRQVCLLGGEPLLHAELPQILAAARALGYATEVCTNGYRGRKRLEACAPYLDLLRVSLDGGTAETHDRIRALGSFAAAWETLQWATARGLRVGATCTLTSENIATIPELAERLYVEGAEELTLHRVRPVGYAATSGVVTPVSWEQTGDLHRRLSQLHLGTLRVNSYILLPERCAPATDVIEKLEIAPDGRVYFSCAEVAGPGRSLKFDFASGTLVGRTGLPVTN